MTVNGGGVTVKRTALRVTVSDVNTMGCQLLANSLRRAHFEVTGCAMTKEDLARSIQEHTPDVTLVSAHLKDGRMSGVQVVRSIRRTHPAVRCIVLLQEHDHDLILAAFRAGAKGVFCRTEPFTLLCKCIRAVHAGQIWIASKDLELVLDAGVTTSYRRELPVSASHLLTNREREVVALVREGISNRDIAQKLFLSEHTVKNHLFHIFEKLGISSRVELLLALGDETAVTRIA